MPYSRLIFRIHAARPTDVVAADNVAAGETVIITAYEPDPTKWDASFTKRSGS